MLKIGLTGGIGSGKSFVSHIFSRLGIPVYDSDKRGKWLMNHNPDVKNRIIRLLGTMSYLNGELNRKFISGKVFNNKELLTGLNQIVHPSVENDFRDWCTQQNTKNAFVIQEAAILFESGAYKNMDYIILVTAPEELRIKRVMERDNISKTEVQNRIKNQFPTEKLMPLADFIIQNNDKELILPQIIYIYQKLVKEWQNMVNGSVPG
jgi:dephospho-CoA kinase